MPITDAAQVERDIRAIPGVVGTGLFLGMAHIVLVGDRSDFRMLEEGQRGERSNERARKADQEPVLGRAGSQSGSTRTREIRVKRRDGSVAVCVDTSTGVTDEGRIVRYQGTLVDVTEPRRRESSEKNAMVRS